MPPELYRTSVYQGEPWSEEITCLESLIPRVAEDLTGYTFVGQVRPYADSATVLATIAIALDADEETGTLAVIRMSLTATLTSAGQTLNGWVTGILVNSEVVTSSSDYWTSAGEGWSSGPSYTFTSNGTRLNVTVEVTISPSVDIAGRGFCALTIVADNGSSASTQRGRETFLRIISGDVVIDVPTSGYYMVGSLSNHANFTLGSTGQTTITVRMYQGGAFTRCTVLSGYLKMYVDVYK